MSKSKYKINDSRLINLILWPLYSKYSNLYSKYSKLYINPSNPFL